MKYNIFISYSTEDEAIANDVCSALEKKGIKCWIAPRDIQPGNPYARAIINGINLTEILLLVLTPDSNVSEYVLNEVDIAFNTKKIIIPFFAKEVTMNPDLKFYLSRKQWFIAYPDYKLQLDNLVKAIADKLGFDINKSEDCEKVETMATASNTINGHEYVDLGLPSGLKWATCNVGATKPEEYGGYYAWGEIEEKQKYSLSTYKWCKGWYEKMIKYCADRVDNKAIIFPEDDVAHVKWGGSWRMPTRVEQDELRNNCTWTWTTQSGVNGYKVTSNNNGNSIFLPAAGYRAVKDLRNIGSRGYYWSSLLYDDRTYYAYRLCFYSDNFDWDYNYIFYGFSVRPVSE